MGIKLDWEVESEAGWSEIGEDAAALEARRRRTRQIRTILSAVLSVGLIVAGAVGWRLMQVSRQIRADLSTTVDAETTAIRIGDREAFLDAQTDLTEWRLIQSRTFEDYTELGDRVSFGDEPVTIDVTADHARVVVLETVDDTPYHRTWYYQRTDQGWYHIPPSPSFWGEEQTEDGPFGKVIYYQQDQGLVDVLAPRLTAWSTAYCSALAIACTQSPSPLLIRVEADPLARLGWASYDADTLIIPSPLLGRVPADGSVDPALFTEIASLLAERWANTTLERYFAEPPRVHSDMVWLRDELSRHLNHRLEESAPSSEFFEPLALQYGDAAVGAFLAEVPNLRDDQSIILVLEAAAGEPVESISVGWGSYLAHRFNAENDLLSRGFNTEAVLLYRDPERPELALDTVLIFDPATPITGMSVEERNGLYWVELHAVVDTQAEAVMVFYQPYRIVDRRWVHTTADITEWGSPQEQRTPHFTLRYYELDTSVVEGLAPALEQAYLQAAAERGFDLVTLPLIEVLITVDVPDDTEGKNDLWIDLRDLARPNALQVIVPSPHRVPTPYPLRDTAVDALLAAMDAITQP